MQHPLIAGRLRARRCAATAAAVAVALLASTAPAALAEKGDPSDKGAFPSKQQVDDARARVARTAQSVAAIKAELALANQRLEQAAVEAEQAAEAYNGALWRLEQAAATEDKARLDAANARRRVDAQRDGIARLVTQTYISGGNLTAVEAFVAEDGPEAIMRRYQAYNGASTSMDAAYQRFTASSQLAEAFERQAEAARVAQEQAAQAAESARDRAAASAQSAQAVSDQVLAQKQALVRRLAQAQGISVKLAQQRQDALAAIAAAKAAAAAKKAAEEEQRRQEAAAAAAAAAAAEQAKDDDKSTSPPAPAPDPPAPSGGVAGAIAFAKAQLGEPYQWGAAGPGSWDCSGLMMGAWGSAGVSLPHYSAAQYAAGTPISVADLRPGDLVFWGTSDDPGSIHHVAMYIGDGMIIHAPRTGRPVSIDSMYYWIPPNFFARV